MLFSANGVTSLLALPVPVVAVRRGICTADEWAHLALLRHMPCIANSGSRIHDGNDTPNHGYCSTITQWRLRTQGISLTIQVAARLQAAKHECLPAHIMGQHWSPPMPCTRSFSPRRVQLHRVSTRDQEQDKDDPASIGGQYLT